MNRGQNRTDHDSSKYGVRTGEELPPRLQRNEIHSKRTSLSKNLREFVKEASNPSLLRIGNARNRGRKHEEAVCTAA